MRTPALRLLLGLSGRIVLASASPRRKKLLEQIGLDCEIIPSALREEDFSTAAAPSDYARELALAKALVVARREQFGGSRGIVIGADTIVELNGSILNKPTDEDDAARMLRLLSGRTHAVRTGIALVEMPGLRFASDVCSTRVSFRPLTEQEIQAYVATGSPLDKAGAYGIQDDFGAVFVRAVEGCYYNVVGLPLETLYRHLRAFCRESEL